MSRGWHTTPVVIISTEATSNGFYPSIAEATKALNGRGINISRQRLFESLNSASGLIRGTDPPLYIDLAMEAYDVEKYPGGVEEPSDDEEDLKPCSR